MTSEHSIDETFQRVQGLSARRKATLAAERFSRANGRMIQRQTLQSWARTTGTHQDEKAAFLLSLDEPGRDDAGELAALVKQSASDLVSS